MLLRSFFSLIVVFTLVMSHSWATNECFQIVIENNLESQNSSDELNPTSISKVIRKGKRNNQFVCIDPNDGRDRYNCFFLTRNFAFRQAREDALIPLSQSPFQVRKVVLLDGNSRVLDQNGQTIWVREYFYKNKEGEVIVIQEHTHGHREGTREAGQLPHFNVRPVHDLHNGKVPGTAAHYNIGNPE